MKFITPPIADHQISLNPLSIYSIATQVSTYANHASVSKISDANVIFT